MVWPQLEILLHYLQIDALRTRVAVAVLAEKGVVERLTGNQAL